MVFEERGGTNLSRLDDIRRLYEILAHLEQRLGGTRRLHGCVGRMAWPTRGVYFFFEGGEQRSPSGMGPRVVRVGTRALTSSSRTTLWQRLSQHRGAATSGGGNHRGSIFRLLVGEALASRDGSPVASWGSGSSAGQAARTLGLEPSAVRDQEHPLEVAVSEAIGTMPFLWVRCDDAPGGASARGLIERNAIALLSNFDKDPIDPPSSAWLGMHSARERVRRSGLWNNNHVDERCEASFLDVLATAVANTPPLDP